jgi:hypothetical protein
MNFFISFIKQITCQLFTPFFSLFFYYLINFVKYSINPRNDVLIFYAS